MASKLSKIGLVIIAGTLLLISGCASLHDTIKDIGYVPVALPSTTHRPGKVVLTVQKDPFQGTTVCEYGSYIGSPQASKDVAASIQASHKLTGTFSLGGDYLKLIKADATYKYITDITVTLSNVSVEEIADNFVFTGLTSQEPGCTQAIEHLADRSRLGFLQNALKADATYKVTLDKSVNLTGEAQQELLEGLALKLGTTPQSVSNNAITGTNLYWGILPPRIDLVLTKDQGKPSLIPTPTAHHNIEYRVNSVDDRIRINLNGLPVYEGTSRGWSSLEVPTGSSQINIEVFNNASYTGGIAAFGGHRREGWHYSVDIRSGNNQWPLTGRRSGEPPLSQFGNWFSVRTLQVSVDSATSVVSVEAI